MARVSPLPPPGPLRTLASATLANTVGTGPWLAGGALYLTRDVGLSASSVGAGLTVAGLAYLLVDSLTAFLMVAVSGASAVLGTHVPDRPAGHPG
ncbi:hypothetical protein [Micromonospora sp. DT227]|uniref:hypothetical protein n=1 Tax=Micromonospora sp. DT227 TaxID=3393433 RepID=UPI003CEF9291